MRRRAGENGDVHTDLSISADRMTVEVDAVNGGRLAQVTVGGVPLFVSPDDVPDEMRRPDGSVATTDWGSYPMVPWAGRIRRGRFEFRGIEHHLPINFGDHAIHGVGFSSVWTVTDQRPDRLRLELELPSDDRWPFGGRAVQDIGVNAGAVMLSIEVTAGDQAFPVSFGWHPWFRTPSHIDFRPTGMYRRDDDGIAVDEIVDVPPGPWDDCFLNDEPVTMTIDGVVLRLTSDCDHWVVYDERRHGTCVEPQTGPPDAFTIAPRIVEPSASDRAWFRIDVVEA